MENERIVQLILLLLAGALFLAAFITGRNHMRRLAAEANAPLGDAPPMGPTARLLVSLGTVLTVGLFVWRIAAAGTVAGLQTNHFDAFLVLAILLAGMVVYFRWTKNLHGLAFFLLPMIAALLIVGAGLTCLQPKPYDYSNIWTTLHICSIAVGTVCFAAACVGGVAYLLAARQLKRKPGAGREQRRWTGLPPLATIERFDRGMVYIGFPALTIVLITGAIRIAQDPAQFHNVSLSPKIVLAILAWIVYGIFLHVPLAPAFRGPRAAWLSIIGFVLFLGGYVAVVLMKWS